MIGIDTNVLVRYLINDNPKQSKAARDIVDSAVMRGEIVFISLPVFCETIWVLTTNYGVGAELLSRSIEELLAHPGFQLERATEISSAIRMAASRRRGLVDRLIGSIARAEGCSTTYTFDRALKNTVGFTVL